MTQRWKNSHVCRKTVPPGENVGGGPGPRRGLDMGLPPFFAHIIRKISIFCSVSSGPFDALQTNVTGGGGRAWNENTLGPSERTILELFFILNSFPFCSVRGATLSPLPQRAQKPKQKYTSPCTVVCGKREEMLSISLPPAPFEFT